MQHRHLEREPLALTRLWDASGRIGLRDAAQSRTLRFRWQEYGEYYSLHLAGNLGLGRITIAGQQDSIKLWRGHINTPLQTSRPADAEAKNAEQLLFEQTGMRLPISFLRAWTLGKSATDTNTCCDLSPWLVTEQPNELPGFSQDGWRVEYSQSQIEGPYRLPRKLRQ